ncbi:MAG: porin family protein [Proteobacteria bacterium]|nr:porin family protein [Pseudomonadota bacterium]
MRRFLLAAMIFGVAQGAYAADMPDLPVLRGSLPEGLSTSRTVWQGYYVGGQASYSSVTSKPSPTLNSDLQSTFIPPTGYPNYPWQPLGSASKQDTGWGGFFGYNSQWDDVVVGIEGNYIHNGLNAFTSSTGYVFDPTLPTSMVATSNATIRSTDFGSARLRAGYVIGCFLPYMFGGVGVGSQTVDRSVSTSPLPQNQNLPTLISSATKTNLVYGYSAGVGVDVMLVGGLFLRAEYEYQRVTSTIESTINSGRVGLGYKF